MEINTLERIDQELDRLVELYGLKPSEWPEDAKRKCKEIFVSMPKALLAETEDLRDKFSATFSS